MRKSFFILLVFLLILGCQQKQETGLAGPVDPFIGTGGHGHTYPGSTVPFGMMQLSPDTRKDSWDGCSGYHYSDNTIMGFSHTHLSGTGIGDYGDIRLMPVTGVVKWMPGTEENPESGYRSRFSHENETAVPGYYKVHLDDYNIEVELTTTKRAGFHRYTFPGSDESSIIIDLTEGVTSDRITELELAFLSDHEIAGLRRTSGWAADQYVYFYAIFSKPFLSKSILKDGDLYTDSNAARGDDLKAYVQFRTGDDEQILVKVGISAVSAEGARKNLESEIKGWNFDRVKDQAMKTWKDELAKIIIEGGTNAQRTTFYTALYHSFLAPNLFSDVDGSYRGHDGQIHRIAGFDIYTVFSLWDTYRAEHPLFTVIQPELTNDLIKTMIDIYEKGGLLPVWELAGNETNCMIGYHSIPVIVDAYVKGYRDFDIEKAYEAMLTSAAQDHFGLKSYRSFGYIPAEDEGSSVSRTLEYAYDDWCIAQIAKELGKTDDYMNFIQRAQSYKNLFDPETKFLRGKRNGMFVSPFDPAEVNFMLTEANTWQYTFYVPQDISGFIELMGGDEDFLLKLDEMFTGGSILSGRNQSDITGMIGQYAHGNEPSHHMAYLYSYAGQAYKTQKAVRRIMDDLYSDKKDGLCGNEDCGQMSAWYVLSAIGFYPVTPGQDIYAFGSPLFDKASIKLDNGKSFIIKTINNSTSNVYIQKAYLNGAEYTRSYIRHSDIMQGGELVFEMGPLPAKDFGAAPQDRPVSVISDHLITPVPYFMAPSGTFSKKMDVALGHIYEDAEIYYTTSGQEAGRYSMPYSDAITLKKTIRMSAKAYAAGYMPSEQAKATFYKINHDFTIEIRHPYSSQYTAGGDIALIDSQRGGKNFQTGAWQGYEGVDLDVIIDLGKRKKINKISVTFLEDQNSWIFLPAEVTFGVSRKPYDFRTVAMMERDLPEKTDQPVIKEFSKNNIETFGRYIKVKAKNIGICPEWHKGAGGKAWIFVDEVVVE